jgi:hypothetical protein
MSLEIKNLVINVHIAGVAADTVVQKMEKLRSEVLDECKELIGESIERMKER